MSTNNIIMYMANATILRWWPNATYIPLARIPFHWFCVGGNVLRYQHVGISNAKLWRWGCQREWFCVAVEYRLNIYLNIRIMVRLGCPQDDKTWSLTTEPMGCIHLQLLSQQHHLCQSVRITGSETFSPLPLVVKLIRNSHHFLFKVLFLGNDTSDKLYI